MVGIVLLVYAAGSGVARATMPSVPISVALESSGSAAVDVDLTVTLTATPAINAERLSLSITLPDQVDLVAGDLTWTGAAQAHESRVLTVTVRPRRAAPAVIRGRARIEFPDGTVLGDMRSLSLNLDGRSKQSLGLAPPKKTLSGEPVIEFRDPR
ncbi:MAG: hypothetical protein ACOYXR_02030 [Nitrospirota bacterium]